MRAILRRPAAILILPVLTLLVLPPAVLMSAGVTGASAAPQVTVREWGRYETRRSGITHKAVRTASGAVNPVTGRRLVKRTTEIFGQLGRSFGIEIDLTGFPPGEVELTIRTLHPPLTNPKTGKTTAVSEYDWPVAGRERVYFGFTFDDRWEIAEGAWTIQIFYRGRKLAEKKFRVVVPLN